MPDGPELSVSGKLRVFFRSISLSIAYSFPDLLRDGGFEPASNNPLFICFIADETSDDGTHPVGFALCYFTYSTWQGKGLFLEDLYVRPSQRKGGVGQKLFSEVARYAESTNRSRVDFHVLDWNPARKFYDKLGATDLTTKDEWLLYRLDKAGIESLSKQWLMFFWINFPFLKCISLIRSGFPSLTGVWPKNIWTKHVGNIEMTKTWAAIFMTVVEWLSK